jgi:hypothetical protein
MSPLPFIALPSQGPSWIASVALPSHFGAQLAGIDGSASALTALEVAGLANSCATSPAEMGLEAIDAAANVANAATGPTQRTRGTTEHSSPTSG